MATWAQFLTGIGLYVVLDWLMARWRDRKGGA